MRFVQYYLDCLSQASYLIGDETTGQAVVVDPRRDVYEYIADAGRHGLTIIGVINTHFPSDFVAGHLELAHATGAWIGYGRRAETDYPIRHLTDGDRIVLGDVTLQIMETPGHTPESISVLVYEHAADTTPYGVLTGDTLVIGDIARPDLVASFGVTADELARMLYHSIGRLMALPDTVRVFPAHGARGRSPKRSSTIGEQSRTTAARLPVNEDDFVAHVEARRSSTPGYFVHDAALNRSVHDLLYVRLAPLEIDDVLERQAQGALVLDARDPATFAAGHLRGSINVPADGRFAETSGIVADPDDEVVLVAPQDRESELRIRLGRVGFDHIAGYLRDPESAVFVVPDQVARARRVTPTELATALAGPRAPIVLDVRTVDELADDGAIFRARHIPLAELPRRLAEIPPQRSIVVYCADDYRSCVAASLLRRNGWNDVADLLGGYEAWTGALRNAGANARPAGVGDGATRLPDRSASHCSQRGHHDPGCSAVTSSHVSGSW